MKKIKFCLWVFAVLFVGCKKITDLLPPESTTLLGQISQALQVVFKSTTQTCVNFGTLTTDELVLENNTWNATNLSEDEYAQCIYLSTNNEENLYGWEWEYPTTTTGINAYPQLIYGWKPWASQSTTAQLPLRLDALNRLKVNYASDVAHSDGMYNLAFDLWLNTSDEVRPENIHFEIMVWEDAHKIDPFGDDRGELSTPNGTYSVTVGTPTWTPEGTQWTYVAFSRQVKRTQGTVDLDLMLNYLIQEEIVPSHYFLSSIEFGTEVGNSSGYAVINQFEIDLQSD